MTKEQLELKLLKYEQEIESLEQRLKVAEENVETHKKASFDQTKELKEIQKVKEEVIQEYKKLEVGYNALAQIFDEYVTISRNTLQQLQGITQASAMLEKNVTQKIQNLNKGVESK